MMFFSNDTEDGGVSDSESTDWCISNYQKQLTGKPETDETIFSDGSTSVDGNVHNACKYAIDLLKTETSEFSKPKVKSDKHSYQPNFSDDETTNSIDGNAYESNFLHDESTVSVDGDTLQTECDYYRNIYETNADRTGTGFSSNKVKSEFQTFINSYQNSILKFNSSYFSNTIVRTETSHASERATIKEEPPDIEGSFNDFNESVIVKEELEIGPEELQESNVIAKEKDGPTLFLGDPQLLLIEHNYCFLPHLKRCRRTNNNKKGCVSKNCKIVKKDRNSLYCDVLNVNKGTSKGPQTRSKIKEQLKNPRGCKRKMPLETLDSNKKHRTAKKQKRVENQIESVSKLDPDLFAGLKKQCQDLIKNQLSGNNLKYSPSSTEISSEKILSSPGIVNRSLGSLNYMINYKRKLEKQTKLHAGLKADVNELHVKEQFPDLLVPISETSANSLQYYPSSSVTSTILSPENTLVDETSFPSSKLLKTETINIESDNKKINVSDQISDIYTHSPRRTTSKIEKAETVTENSQVDFTQINNAKESLLDKLSKSETITGTILTSKETQTIIKDTESLIPKHYILKSIDPLFNHNKTKVEKDEKIDFEGYANKPFKITPKVNSIKKKKPKMSKSTPDKDLNIEVEQNITNDSAISKMSVNLKSLIVYSSPKSISENSPDLISQVEFRDKCKSSMSPKIQHTIYPKKITVSPRFLVPPKEAIGNLNYSEICFRRITTANKQVDSESVSTKTVPTMLDQIQCTPSDVESVNAFDTVTLIPIEKQEYIPVTSVAAGLNQSQCSPSDVESVNAFEAVTLIPVEEQEESDPNEERHNENVPVVPVCSPSTEEETFENLAPTSSVERSRCSLKDHCLIKSQTTENIYKFSDVEENQKHQSMKDNDNKYENILTNNEYDGNDLEVEISDFNFSHAESEFNTREKQQGYLSNQKLSFDVGQYEKDHLETNLNKKKESIKLDVRDIVTQKLTENVYKLRYEVFPETKVGNSEKERRTQHLQHDNVSSEDVIEYHQESLNMTPGFISETKTVKNISAEINNSNEVVKIPVSRNHSNHVYNTYTESRFNVSRKKKIPYQYLMNHSHNPNEQSRSLSLLNKKLKERPTKRDTGLQEQLKMKMNALGVNYRLYRETTRADFLKGTEKTQFPRKQHWNGFSKMVDLDEHNICTISLLTPHQTCDLCFKYFNDKQSLMTHFDIVHRTRVFFTCAFCGKLFVQPKYFKEHFIGHGKIKARERMNEAFIQISLNDNERSSETTVHSKKERKAIMEGYKNFLNYSDSTPVVIDDDNMPKISAVEDMPQISTVNKVGLSSDDVPCCSFTDHNSDSDDEVFFIDNDAIPLSDEKDNDGKDNVIYLEESNFKKSFENSYSDYDINLDDSVGEEKYSRNNDLKFIYAYNLSNDTTVHKIKQLLNEICSENVCCVITVLKSNNSSVFKIGVPRKLLKTVLSSKKWPISVCFKQCPSGDNMESTEDTMSINVKFLTLSGVEKGTPVSYIEIILKEICYNNIFVVNKLSGIGLYESYNIGVPEDLVQSVLSSDKWPKIWILEKSRPSKPADRKGCENYADDFLLFIRLSGVDRNTPISKIRQILTEICGSDCYTINKLITRERFSAFKIGVPQSLALKVLTSKKWPKTVHLIEWDVESVVEYEDVSQNLEFLRLYGIERSISVIDIRNILKDICDGRDFEIKQLKNLGRYSAFKIGVHYSITEIVLNSDKWPSSVKLKRWPYEFESKEVCSRSASPIYNTEYLRLYGVDRNISIDNIRNILKDICGGDAFQLKQVKAMGRYATFKIGIPYEIIDNVLNSEKWPVNMSVQRWTPEFTTKSFRCTSPIEDVDYLKLYGVERSTPIILIRDIMKDICDGNKIELKQLKTEVPNTIVENVLGSKEWPKDMKLQRWPLELKPNDSFNLNNMKNNLRNASPAKHIEYLRLYGVDRSKPVVNIKEILRNICDGNEFVIKQLKTIGRYAAFKIGVPGKIIENVLSSEKWPKNIKLQRWPVLYRKESNRNDFKSKEDNLQKSSANKFFEYLRVYGVDKSKPSVNIWKVLEDICDDNEFQIKQLKTMGRYAAFKVGVPSKIIGNVLNSEIWAKNIKLQHWPVLYEKPAKRKASEAKADNLKNTSPIETFHYLRLYGVDRSMPIVSIKQIITDICDRRKFKFKQLKTMGRYASFEIGVSEDIIENVLNSEKWPKNMKVQHWPLIR